MKFSCEKTVLQEALLSCSRAVDTRSTLDVMKGILLRADKDGVTVTGSSIELSIVAQIEAEVERDGIVVLESRLLSEIVRKLPDGTVTIDVNERWLASIICCMSEFSLTALPPENYPAVPEVDGQKALSLSQPMLRGMISDVGFAVSDSDSKVVHTGVLFDLEPEQLTMVALDGHRLALAKETIENADTFSFVVPAGSLKEVERMLLEDEESNVTLHCGGRHILFELGQMTVVSRLLDGEFLKYKNALPQTNTYSALLARREVLDGVERVGLLINEKLKNPIRFQFDNDALDLHCLSALGQAHDRCPVITDPNQTTQKLEIGFNHRYVIDALRHLKTDNVRIETAGALAPCLFLPEGDESRLYMVLPVRLTA